MTNEELLALLPHRPPFRFVDACFVDENGRGITTQWTPQKSWDVLAGHFPGRPVVPGVILVEAMAQAACLLGFALDPETQGRPVALVGIDGARFRRPVRPGERVDVRIELERRRGKIWSFRARARVGGEVAAEADLLAAVKGIEK